MDLKNIKRLYENVDCHIIVINILIVLTEAASYSIPVISQIEK